MPGTVTSAELSARSILVVDDTPANLQMLAGMLKRRMATACVPCRAEASPSRRRKAVLPTSFSSTSTCPS